MSGSDATQYVSDKAGHQHKLMTRCSKVYIIVSSFAGHNDIYLAIARYQNIARLLGLNGYNPRYKYKLMSVD